MIAPTADVEVGRSSFPRFAFRRQRLEIISPASWPFADFIRLELRIVVALGELREVVAGAFARIECQPLESGFKQSFAVLQPIDFVRLGLLIVSCPREQVLDVVMSEDIDLVPTRHSRKSVLSEEFRWSWHFHHSLFGCDGLAVVDGPVVLTLFHFATFRFCHTHIANTAHDVVGL